MKKTLILILTAILLISGNITAFADPVMPASGGSGFLTIKAKETNIIPNGLPFDSTIEISNHTDFYAKNITAKVSIDSPEGVYINGDNLLRFDNGDYVIGLLEKGNTSPKSETGKFAIVVDKNVKSKTVK
ncbi:MAG: hypothetical protein Q4P29_03135, partial [Tissierellia bacterium]|nr:hypothetical protein [Tissierellia bacterium]